MIPQVGAEPKIDATIREKPSHHDMVFIPGGTFRMGSDRHYPEEAPVHRVTVDAVLDRSNAGHQPRVPPASLTRRAYVTVAEIAPDPKDYPGALPHMLKPGSLVFTPPRRPVDLSDWQQLVEVRVWRELAPPVRPRQIEPRPRRPSRGAYRATGRRSLCRLGGQGAADRSRVGMRRAWRPRRGRISRGAMNLLPAAATWRIPGRAHSRAKTSSPTAMRAPRRSCVSAQRLRAIRHDRQRVGMDGGLVLGPPRRGRTEGVLHSGKSSRRAKERTATTRMLSVSADPPKSRERRLAPLRTELLPSLSPGRASCAADRYVV